eukprot:438711-Pelagomonas_calceolata.AAC.4
MSLVTRCLLRHSDSDSDSLIRDSANNASWVTVLSPMMLLGHSTITNDACWVTVPAMPIGSQSLCQRCLLGHRDSVRDAYWVTVICVTVAQGDLCDSGTEC